MLVLGDGYVPAVPEPRVLLGRYEIGDLIGAGGSARVYRARDRLLGRIVAVKLLDADAAQSSDPAAHERFLREAQTSAGFAHRHSVATFDAGDADGHLFLVMEFVDGVSLAQRIASDAPMAESEVVRIAGQVLEALGAAHTSGLVHRDVKPANILLDAVGDVKLADFGIAKRFDELSESLTVAGMVIGTRDYLAPEQAAGRAVGPQVDLYALGVVLFEMATGVRPNRSVGASTDPRTLRADLTPTLATSISTALSQRPDDRFASASAMAAALTVELPPTELSLSRPERTTPSTLVMPIEAAASATEPMTSKLAGRVDSTTMTREDVAEPASGGARWFLIGALVLTAFAVAIVIAARDDGDATVAGDESATLTSAIESASPTTEGSTATTAGTTAPPTAPPTSTAAPPLDELVPGFAATDDLDRFIEQLRDAKGTAGKQAKKLGDALKKIRDEDDPDDRQGQIEKLDEQLDEWVGKGDLESAVANAAREFLRALS